MHKRTLTLGVGLAILAVCAPAAFAGNIYVTNTNDSGPGSLRNAIAGAASGDTIVFNPKAIRFPATITVASPLMISQNLTINGPGVSLLFISGGHTVGVFYIRSAVVSIAGLTIQNGLAVGGGGVFNLGGTVTLSNMMLYRNSAFTGGGILNDGTLTVTNSTLSLNEASAGGGITNYGTAIISNSTLYSNAADAGGGIFTEFQATLMVADSTLTYNAASGIGGGIYTNRAIITLKNTIVANSYLGGNC
ncbi:MAG TPA: hypothetical protein VN841_14310 [Bryobacteraceae bacterium]|nr:hypothetical protein [Bryobacteraceae bacterium]